MTRSGRQAMLSALAVVAACIAGFVLLQHDVRVGEAHAVAGLLAAVGATGTHVVLGTNVQVLPDHPDTLVASITPSCSSLASLLAISCLAIVGRSGMPRRMWPALLVALAVIAIGNVVRMAASLGVGVVAGRPALLLFHDWVGGVFTFVYTLAGYVLFLYLTLPRRGPTSPAL
jgi:exosortase/archaeosortase family protein